MCVVFGKIGDISDSFDQTTKKFRGTMIKARKTAISQQEATQFVGNVVLNKTKPNTLT